MDGKIVTGSLLDLGPHALCPQAKRSVFGVTGGRAKLRTQVRTLCPRKPGIYAMIDARQQIIYVGKAKSLRTRLLGYFRVRGRDAKAGRIVARTRTLLWETCANEFAALLRELELIQRWRPRFNVVGLPRWRNYVWVCVGRQPAHYAFLSRRLRGQVQAFGPVPAGPRAREAVRRLNNLFGLRDCPQSQHLFFSEQGELFPMLHTPGCLRYEIATCLGPCVGACTRSQYEKQLLSLRAFLDGNDSQVLVTLEHEMTAAAAEHRYEKAGAIRDRLSALQWLHARLEQMRRIRADGSFIYAARGKPVDYWYLILAGRTVASLPAPGDTRSFKEAAARIEATYIKSNGHPGLADYENFEGVLLVDAWFRKYPQERKRIMTPEQAIAICQAGDASEEVD